MFENLFTDHEALCLLIVKISLNKLKCNPYFKKHLAPKLMYLQCDY